MIKAITFLALFISLATCKTNRQAAKESLSYIQDLPYKLTNIIIFEPYANSTLVQTISFRLNDPNPGMNVTDTCIRSAPANGTLLAGGYDRCNEAREAWPEHPFRFGYDTGGDGPRGRKIRLARLLVDASLGEYPNNWTRCFGEGTLVLHDTIQLAGVLRTQSSLEINCTEMAP
ncbi:hypothetical protein EJ08DRAFT_691493 [Tothia fuscella]|uniref:Lipoprotein n=1 Tax=Tothia fuscella TaxID=1048955 RepID=A0A9P4P4K1_9PEZI|nr:hypothetical protein EJ08DRAFT_691493 [Tothia fuscella]